MAMGIANESKKVPKVITKLLRFTSQANKMALVFFLIFSGILLGADSSFGSTLWDSSTVPAILSDSDTSAVELGVKFQSSVDGYITALRFYKASANTGTHVGNLWTTGGTLLASVTFSNETSSGWQEMALSTPVAVTANTTYVASYHTKVGRYSADSAYFTSTYDNPPLRAPSNSEGGGNGVYRYGSSAFPNQTYNATNYWVDVVFEENLGPDTTPPTVSTTLPASGAVNVSTGTMVKVTFSEAMDETTIDETSFKLQDALNSTVLATISYDNSTRTATLVPDALLEASTMYTVVVKGGAGGVADVAGNPLTADYSWSFTTGTAGTSGSFSLWDSTFIPSILSDSDTSSVELGVKFQSNADGYITALRFYKASANTGTHVGNLWTAGGTLLASVTFSNETASGWQEMSLSTPVEVTANTTYVASYHTNVGRYSADSNYFASAYDNPPLRTPSNSESVGNGVYRYGASAFPNQTWNATNYWVDVVYQESIGSDATPPVVADFIIPSTAETLTVPITSFIATDNVGVTGYMVTETSTAPLSTAPGWSATAPTAHTFATEGSKTLYAWAKDAAGNVSVSLSASVDITLADATPPEVTEFIIPSTATMLTVSITSFIATDNMGVTGYMVTETSTAPLSTAPGWSATAPTSYTFGTEGSKTLYAWAKDAAGNVSAGVSASVVITLPDVMPPVVTDFIIPSTAETLTVPIISFIATDNVGVTGYMVTESSTAPSAGAVGWTATGPTSYTFTTAGSKTLYAWAKDAAGNVSTSLSAPVDITLPDSTAPTVTAFTIPSTAETLTVPIISFIATDNVGVTGYMVTESSTAPSAGAVEWTATGPTSYTFTTAGSKTLYAWAKDAAGNVSTSLSAPVDITLPDSTAPTVTAFTIPSTAEMLTVPIISFIATDNIGVTGYMVTESSTAPSAGAVGWTATGPTSYTFTTAGSKTLYAWAKDAAGNVSTSLSAPVDITILSAGPEPAGWFAGDVHVHRSCGGSPEAISSMHNKMEPQNLAVISLLADMGNGEVQDPVTDLPRVNGQDDPVSTPGRIVHWDTEWHWDATYSGYDHQALGGHILALGLSHAEQIWEEYTYPIINWAHQQGGIAGFAHMQYLDYDIPQSLDCCKPIEYPVEVALGSADFIEEDVNGSDSFIESYYRLLNTGFRPGFAAGTDYPCGVSELGSLLTYVKVSGGEMTYRNWIEGIAQGRTVISRNGHNEFLDLKVNSTFGPGDEIDLTGGGSLPVTVQWTAKENLTGTIELVQNGNVVASVQKSIGPGAPASLNTTVNFTNSGWLAARRMGSSGHMVHTAAVFVKVDGAPVRASVADAEFYVQWIDNLMDKTSPGGEWNSYFENNLAEAQARYQQARAIFQQIALEAGGVDTPPAVMSVSPANGSASVSTGTAVTVTFSEPMEETTIDGNTFELRDSANNLVPASVTYNGTTNTATLTPTSLLVNSATYTAKVLSGPNGVTDEAGTPLETDYIWSFTTAAAGSPGSYSLWNDTFIPATLSDSDTIAVELGVKLQSNVDGFITALRFYKSSTNTGTHVGNLWTAGGTLLASVTFNNETASGWQEMALPTPVAVTANTTYIASYHTNVGRYSSDSAYFNSAYVNPPLRALSTGENGGNGVYLYGAGGFPNQTWNASNYWVDVIFQESLEPPDTTPPAVTSVFPADGATGVSTTVAVRVTFSEAMNSATINGSTFVLRGNSGDVVSAAVSYNSGSNTATLSPSVPLAVGEVYTATVVGSVGGVADASGNSLAANYIWSFTTAATPVDTTPPTVISVTPESGATEVNVGTQVIVNFSEAMNPATINISSFTLNGVSATIDYSEITNTATLTPAVGLADATTYTAIVKGGSSGVTDLAGNYMTSDFSWSFTTLSTPVDTTPPTVISMTPANGATEVNVGTQVVVTFSEAMDPATINTSTFMLNGVSAAVVYNAATNTTTLTPAAALADATTYTAVVKGGSAGVMDLSGNRMTIDYSWSFTTASSSGGDTTPPTVTAVLPPNHAPEVSTGSSLFVTFSEAMTTATINNTTFELHDSSDALIPAAVSYDSEANKATLIPTIPLAVSSFYTAIVKGGTNGVKDAAGNPLASDYSWTFVSSASNPFDNGPGGPILVISSASGPFSRYYAEILRAEGLNDFAIRDLSSVSSAILDQYDVVILGETPLTSTQVTMLTNWVTNGGNLIAMRPDKQLAGLLGLVDAGTTLSQGYLLVDTNSGPGSGIVGQTIQFHGTADRYTLGSAAALAMLYSNATTPTSNPAVTLRNVGTNGGQAAAFTFDLARSIVYSRQGNPAWAGQERDGTPPIRPDDLFYGDAAGDPQPDWIDLNKVAIPQADEEQRLLANMIIRMNADKKPLPRFWYFPNDHEAVVIMSGDDHGQDGTAGRFDDEITNSSAGCSVDDWECIRSSSYIFPDPSGAVTDAEAANYDALGFEIGVHINTECADYTAR